MELEEGLDPRRPLAKGEAPLVGVGPEIGDHTRGVEAEGPRDVDGAGEMEPLSDHQAVGDLEDVPGAVHRLVRVKTGVVHEDVRVGDAPVQAVLPHHVDLVVGGLAVIAREQDLLHLALPVEGDPCVQPVGEHGGGGAVGVDEGPKDDGHLRLGGLLRAGDDVAARRMSCH